MPREVDGLVARWGHFHGEAARVGADNESARSSGGEAEKTPFNFFRFSSSRVAVEIDLSITSTHSREMTSR